MGFSLPLPMIKWTCGVLYHLQRLTELTRDLKDSLHLQKRVSCERMTCGLYTHCDLLALSPPMVYIVLEISQAEPALRLCFHTSLIVNRFHYLQISIIFWYYLAGLLKRPLPPISPALLPVYCSQCIQATWMQNLQDTSAIFNGNRSTPCETAQKPRRR